ncbi:transposase [Candidatus Woesearchaeota archaeon]|nr:transposase [Candidatus Woesearchaeota archaeon]
MKVKQEIRRFIIKNLALTEEQLQVVQAAAKLNTYVETLSNKADGLHINIKEYEPEHFTRLFKDQVKSLIRKLRLGLADLVCDVTSEDFYGKVEGLYIHPWTGEDGVKGKYSYFVAGILFRNKIIPFYLVILRIGSSMAEHIGKAIRLCQSSGLKIGKVLLDRGFYTGEVINTLKISRASYLVFVPKKPLFKCMLEGTNKSVVVEHEIKYNKDFTKKKANTNILLVKDVCEYDWVFASNLKLPNIASYVRVYRKRWNIETMFRVHDEARIKSKSKIPVIRLFYFIISMLLLLIWNLFAKTKMTFKLFVIQLSQDAEWGIKSSN